MISVLQLGTLGSPGDKHVTWSHGIKYPSIIAFNTKTIIVLLLVGKLGLLFFGYDFDNI